MMRHQLLERRVTSNLAAYRLLRPLAWAAALSSALMLAALVTPADASPLQGIGPNIFLHSGEDVQPEDVSRDQWEKLIAQVKERLEESGLEVETGDWFAAQKAYEHGERNDAPGARVIVSLMVLKDKEGRYVYSVRVELRELGYFPRPAGAGYKAQGQYLHMDLSFFPEGMKTAPPDRLPRWQAVQSVDVASYSTDGSLGYSTWDGVVKGVVAEADRLGQAWKRAQ